MASSQEGEKAKLKFSTESFDFRLHKVVFEQIRQGVIRESDKAKNALQDVTIEEGMKQEEKSPVFLASKIELMRVIAKLKCLLKQMKSLQEVKKLESQSWKMRLGVNVVKAKSVLPKKKEKKRLEALGWEMQLEEDVAKSELLIEEMELIRVVKKVGSPMLEMQLKEHISKVESVLENVKKEESKTESPASRMELKELEFLLEKLKLEQEPGKLQSLPLEIELERHIVKLKLLLGETKLEKEEERQRFQLFKMELKKDIEKFLTMQIWSRYDMRLWLCLVKERSLLEKMKSLKEESTIEQLKEHTLEFESLLNDMKSVNLKAKLKFRKFEMEFHSNIVELEPILEKLELKEEEEELRLKEEEEELRLKELVAKSEILLEEIILKPTGKGHLAKLEELIAEMNSLLRNIKVKQHNVFFVWDRTATLNALLKKMKMVQRELEFSTWRMELNKRHVKELEFVLERIELVRQKGLQSRLSRELEIELNESMESLVEMKLKQEEGRESLLLQVILEELIMKLKMLLKRTESPGSVEMLKSQVSEMQLEELLAKFRLETIKCERAKRKTELPTETRKLTPREHKEQSRLVESQSVIVIGGRGEYGESLKSVEGYIFLEGKWIELPAMNTPRSFMSSVVVGQEVIVSGGDTGDAITDSIEVLDLVETPVQWRVSPARLPVPLSAHKTVVYKGKLIVIGGHDDNEGRISDKIYEVLLTPPYTTTTLSLLPQPRAWHGAELVNDKVFILGGGGNSWFPTDDVLVYDLSENRCSAMSNLPYRVQGMATVRRWDTVMLLGGVDEDENELQKVISYDIESGTVLSI